MPASAAPTPFPPMTLIPLPQFSSRGAHAGQEEQPDRLLLQKLPLAPQVSGAGAAGQLWSHYTPMQGFVHLEIPLLPPDSQPCFLTMLLASHSPTQHVPDFPSSPSGLSWCN